jgi:predicted RNA-binding Zn ribbon-like protein
VEQGLIDPEESVSERSLQSASLVHTALHQKVEGRNGAAPTAAELSVIDEAARDAGLELHFDPEGPSRIESTAPGVAGALGRILAAAFLAELDGTWERLKQCSDDTCTSVFYDRSKNHSGKWCSMRSCGNRNKVRAWRERQHAGGPPA